MSMESALKSLNSSAKSPSFMASKQYHSVHHQPSTSKTPPFPQPPATPPQPPLLPLPARLHAPPQHAAWPASRPVPQRAKKPRHAAVAAPSPKNTAPAQAQGASAPLPVQAAPSKKRTAATATEQEAVEWTTTDSLYSVSPPPSCVPMPTSLLVSAAAGRKAPTACAVEVAGGVDIGATDELRRLLRL